MSVEMYQTCSSSPTLFVCMHSLFWAPTCTSVFLPILTGVLTQCKHSFHTPLLIRRHGYLECQMSEVAPHHMNFQPFEMCALKTVSVTCLYNLLTHHLKYFSGKHTGNATWKGAIFDTCVHTSVMRYRMNASEKICTMASAELYLSQTLTWKEFTVYPVILERDGSVGACACVCVGWVRGGRNTRLHEGPSG